MFVINLPSGVVYLSCIFLFIGRRKKSSKSNLLDEIETEKIESADKASSEEEILIKSFCVRVIKEPYRNSSLSRFYHITYFILIPATEMHYEGILPYGARLLTLWGTP